MFCSHHRNTFLARNLTYHAKRDWKWGFLNRIPRSCCSFQWPCESNIAHRMQQWHNPKTAHSELILRLSSNI
jgi:hypothetical protein